MRSEKGTVYHRRHRSKREGRILIVHAQYPLIDTDHTGLQYDADITGGQLLPKEFSAISDMDECMMLNHKQNSRWLILGK